MYGARTVTLGLKVIPPLRYVTAGGGMFTGVQSAGWAPTAWVPELVESAARKRVPPTFCCDTPLTPVSGAPAAGFPTLLRAIARVMVPSVAYEPDSIDPTEVTR